MSLETETEVREIQTVQDDQGDSQFPANQQRQKEIRDAVGNFAGLDGFVHTTGGTTEEQLQSVAVPDGATVLVSYKIGNADTVLVGPQGVAEYPLAGPGDAWETEVTDTSEIYVRALSAGDEVAVMFEVDG
jgi:hypothetical protein